MAAALQMLQHFIAYVHGIGPIGYLLYVLARHAARWDRRDARGRQVGEEARDDAIQVIWSAVPTAPLFRAAAWLPHSRCFNTASHTSTASARSAICCTCSRGTLLGGIAAMLVAVKSVKKLVTMPFK